MVIEHTNRMKVVPLFGKSILKERKTYATVHSNIQHQASTQGRKISSLYLLLCDAGLHYVYLCTPLLSVNIHMYLHAKFTII